MASSSACKAVTRSHRGATPQVWSASRSAHIRCGSRLLIGPAPWVPPLSVRWLTLCAVRLASLESRLSCRPTSQAHRWPQSPRARPQPVHQAHETFHDATTSLRRLMPRIEDAPVVMTSSGQHLRASANGLGPLDVRHGPVPLRLFTDKAELMNPASPRLRTKAQVIGSAPTLALRPRRSLSSNVARCRLKPCQRAPFRQGGAGSASRCRSLTLDSTTRRR